MILWLPLSAIAVANRFQDNSTFQFYLFVFFVPVIGAGFLKGLIELLSGIGWFYGWRISTEPIIRIWPLRHSVFKVAWYHFTLEQKRVRLVGMIRLVLNTAVLITLLVIQLF